ncbi:BTAD domain-containing putative transcriptional regulator [Actinomadura chokoriensis]|uniref:BTAD domain-containing putative transcriptional regulator n=1 Tax=Actinomadura chokoriensis TaxID=454156 RepID=UPI0031F73A18
MPREGSSPRFEILGRPTAWRDGRELDLGPGKQRAVLAVLLLTPRRPVPTASIVTAVWGDDPPDNGANVVQKYVAGLRRVLEPDRSPRTPGRLLTLTAGGYALHVPPEGLDTEVFQERVKAAQAAEDAAQTEEMLREALAMWRGPALAGLTGAFFDAARNRLEEMRAAALEACAEAGLDAGEHTRLVPELLRLVAEFPLREGFRSLLMLALYRSGRQAEALAAYRDARDFLADEFGVDPGERLRALHQAILRSDPTLTPPKRNTPTPPPQTTPPTNPPPSPPAADLARSTTPADPEHNAPPADVAHGAPPTDDPGSASPIAPAHGTPTTEHVLGASPNDPPSSAPASGLPHGTPPTNPRHNALPADLAHGTPATGLHQNASPADPAHAAAATRQPHDAQPTDLPSSVAASAGSHDAAPTNPPHGALPADSAHGASPAGMPHSTLPTNPVHGAQPTELPSSVGASGGSHGGSHAGLAHAAVAAGLPHGAAPADPLYGAPVAEVALGGAVRGVPDGVRTTGLVHGGVAGGLPYGVASGHGLGAAAQEAVRGGVPAEVLYGALPVHDVLTSGAGPRLGAVGGGRRVSWALRAVLMGLPPLSFGLVTWALVAYYAARRRSRALAGMAVGYLALSVVFLVGATSGDPEQSSPWDGPLFFALLATMFGGAVHLALLTAESPGGVNVQLIERRARREQARSLAAHHPVIAHRLGIGRPDLATGFDDGGLVDVNSAPEHVLASLPGLDAHHAKLIVLARAAQGPLASVDDLVARQILPYQVVDALREMMIAVPPMRDTELVL